MTKTLADCQHDSVILSALIEGIDLMDNEGQAFDEARVAVTGVALEKARALCDALERVQVAEVAA